ncbi:hypothetical protein BDR07DRAFT_1376905 [Suillus spraguei]|nr:hypothetical protein BDR07DRAFT_1376905 [Suillus spraguei]
MKNAETGHYVGIEGDAGNDTKVVAVSSPFKWDVRDSDVVLKALDPEDGNAANHTKIKLRRSCLSLNQIWAFTERICSENRHAYSLRNCLDDRAVNISGDDNYSIDCSRPLDNYSQAWIFQQDDDKDGWFIKASCSGKYLGIEGDVANRTRVVAVSSPFKWDIRDSREKSVEGIRILVHGTNFGLDLENSHSAKQAKIQLWESLYGIIRKYFMQIISITTAVREALIMGDLLTAEELLIKDINTDSNNYTSYSQRSFIMYRQHKWDHALQDANKSISIQPSLTGYISKGFALRGRGYVQGARAAFDVASMYTDQDSQTTHFLLLIKAMALYSVNRHNEADLLLEELTIGCPTPIPAHAYLRVQLEVKALKGKHHSKAAEQFTTAVNCSALSSTSDIHDLYGDLIVLLGWDLKSYRYVMDTSDITKDSCPDWSNGKSRIRNVTQATILTTFHPAFTKECSALSLTGGYAALSAKDYHRAIELYSAVINLDYALRDAQKVIELNPSSSVGYQLSYKALRGAQRHDKAIDAFTIMLSKLDDAIDAFTTMSSKLDDASKAQIRELRQQYVHPSQADLEIERAVGTELENAPLRLLNTSTGLLCDRAAQRNAFKTSPEYNELKTKDSNLRTKHTSKTWEETEVLLHDIQGKVMYELNGLGGIAKLRSFCKVARDAGYGWAWMDTCCIDKTNNSELQESVNSMFVWYRHSALTIVYLCDVAPSSQPGALATSVWNERGWTFQELVASKVVIFYQKDWSLHLGDRSTNHKESPTIMKELEDATSIDPQALLTFRPGMSEARKKLQWASKRVTTKQEDVAYSLFGIFGITLPVIYGEGKQRALGRLLQEIVAQSGDISVLDWIGQPSEFNSCLPADITSYATPPRIPPSLSEDYIHAQVSSLRQTMPTDLALNIYNQLKELRAPRFANCRLHLPCISFRVTQVRRKHGLAQDSRIMYDIKADGLHELSITTEENLVQFLRAKPPRQTLLLVRPWDRHLLADYAEQPDFTDDTESIGYETGPESPIDGSQVDDSDKLSGGSPVEEEPGLQALRLMVRLQQPFDVFLLAQQPVGEYKRIASDYNIFAQVKDIASVGQMNIDSRPPPEV